MSIIKLKSSDGVVIETEIEIAKCSGTIKDMLDSAGLDDEEGCEVPLNNVNSAILRKVLLWAKHHKDDQKPVDNAEIKEKRTDDISPWDADFLKTDQATLFELLLAANFLNISGLFESTCKMVANMMKGKTPEEIRKTFNIKNDLTVAEEGQIRKKSE